MSHTPAGSDATTVMMRLKTQIEFYFSAANLRVDEYLKSQQDADGFVSVSVIANFPKVMSLSTDLEVINSAIKDSKYLEFDSTKTKIRSCAPQRLTLILRKAPATLAEKTIRSLFASRPELAAKITSVRPDIADTWFIMFADESSCVSAASFLPSQTLNGAPVSCTVKPETPHSSYFARPNPAAQAWVPGTGYVTGATVNPRSDAFVPGTFKSGSGAQASRPAGKGKGRNAAGKGSAPAAASGKDRDREFPSLDKGAAAIGVAVPPVRTGYSVPFTSFTREHMASIVQNLIANPLPAPPGFPASRGSPAAVAAAAATVGLTLTPSTEVKPDAIARVPVLRSRPTSSCVILEPIPVMFPASPSPAVLASPSLAAHPPFLDLGSASSGAGGLPTLPSLPTLGGAAGAAGALPSLDNITSIMSSMTFSVPATTRPGGSLPLPSSAPAIAPQSKTRARAAAVGGKKPYNGNNAKSGNKGHPAPVQSSGPSGWAAIVAAPPSPRAVAAAQAQQNAIQARKAAAAAAVAAAKKADEPAADAATSADAPAPANGSKGSRAGPGARKGAPAAAGGAPRSGANAGKPSGPRPSAPRGGPKGGAGGKGPKGPASAGASGAAAAPAAAAGQEQGAPASRWADLLKSE